MPTTDETKRNIAQFYELVVQRRMAQITDDCRTMSYDKAVANYERDALAIARQCLRFATQDYVVGEPQSDDQAITCGMNVAGMGGIIMYRDREVTAHT